MNDLDIPETMQEARNGATGEAPKLTYQEAIRQALAEGLTEVAAVKDRCAELGHPNVSGKMIGGAKRKLAAPAKTPKADNAQEPAPAVDSGSIYQATELLAVSDAIVACGSINRVQEVAKFLAKLQGK
jgi:hypothetical protein